MAGAGGWAATNTLGLEPAITVLPVAKGGTGFSTIASQSLVFANSANSLAGNKDQAVICRIAKHNNHVLRRLLELAQQNARITLRHHPAQLTRAQHFYDQALALLKPIDCDRL